MQLSARATPETQKWVGLARPGKDALGEQEATKAQVPERPSFLEGRDAKANRHQASHPSSSGTETQHRPPQRAPGIPFLARKVRSWLSPETRAALPLDSRCPVSREHQIHMRHLECVWAPWALRLRTGL